MPLTFVSLRTCKQRTPLTCWSQAKCECPAEIEIQVVTTGKEEKSSRFSKFISKCIEASTGERAHTHQRYEWADWAAWYEHPKALIPQLWPLSNQGIGGKGSQTCLIEDFSLTALTESWYFVLINVKGIKFLHTGKVERWICQLDHKHRMFRWQEKACQEVANCSSSNTLVTSLTSSSTIWKTLHGIWSKKTHRSFQNWKSRIFISQLHQALGYAYDIRTFQVRIMHIESPRLCLQIHACTYHE